MSDTTDGDTNFVRDVAVFPSDSDPGLVANLSRLTLKQVIEDWENHPEKAG